MDFDLEELDSQISDCLEENKDNLNTELINQIHPDVNIPYNSLNIAVGRQRSGKTFTIIRELIKISYADPRAHLLIYITKNGKVTDPTFLALQKLLRIPVLSVAEEKAEDTVKNILKWKQFYNQIISNNWYNEITDKQLQDTATILHLTSFSQPSLHTLIFFEDAANSPLFKSKENYFNTLLAKLAHVQCSVFLAVQFWKSLPTEFKANASTVFLFPGFSKEQITYFLRQVPLDCGKDEFFDYYSRLKDHQKMIININQRSVKIE